MIEPLTNEQIECLNGWPVDHAIHAQERQLIQHVNQLCITFGYGRIGQIAAALEEIWRNPEEGGKKWQEFQDGRMKLLKGDLEYFNTILDERDEEKVDASQ